MSVEFILRIVGMLVFAFIGGYWGGLAGRIAKPIKLHFMLSSLA